MQVCMGTNSITAACKWQRQQVRTGSGDSDVYTRKSPGPSRGLCAPRCTQVVAVPVRSQRSTTVAVATTTRKGRNNNQQRLQQQRGPTVSLSRHVRTRTLAGTSSRPNVERTQTAQRLSTAGKLLRAIRPHGCSGVNGGSAMPHQRHSVYHNVAQHSGTVQHNVAKHSSTV